MDVFTNDERNYALSVNKEFFVHAVSMETALMQGTVTMEAVILGALEDQRLCASPADTTTINTTIAELRSEITGVFCEHRALFN